MASKYLIFVMVLFTLFGCNLNTVVNTNESVSDKKWLYNNVAKSTFKIDDAHANYKVNFKLRINAEYRYANLFVLATLKNDKARKKVRYQFKLAKADGAWLGKGSGDLYTYVLPIFNNYRFTDTGTYHIEVEQNMRDNPLLGVSDIGIEVTKH